MEIGAIDRTVLGGVSRATSAMGGGASFEAVLRQQAEASDGDRGKVRKAAEEFVSMALVEPILAKVRSMNMAAEPFAPGEVEKAFGPLLDAEWSKGIVQASGWGLVDRVEQWMTQRARVEVTHG